MSTETIERFYRCKKELIRVPTLQIPDLDSTFILTTDASGVALGAVLSQKHEEEERPLGFASRKLSPPETRYSAIERELLGIVWGIEYFRPYLFGKEFVIKTDHKPLLWVQGLKENSSRITKWKERLAPYNFSIEHVKGQDNVVADCLSRNINYNETAGAEEEPPSLRYHRERAESVTDLRPVEEVRVVDEERPETPQELGSEDEERPVIPQLLMEKEDSIINDKRHQVHVIVTEGDRIRMHCRRYGPIRINILEMGEESGEENLKKALNEILKKGIRYYLWISEEMIRGQITELYESGSINAGVSLVMYLRKVETVEDPERQNRIIDKYHMGITNHRGPIEATAKLRKKYYWLSMRRKIVERLSKCRVCRQVKYDRNPHKPTQEITPTPHATNEVVEVDLFQVDKQRYLTIIDRFSRQGTAWPLRNKKAESIAEAFIWFFGIKGRPDKMVMDRGREFRNKKIKKLLDEFGVKKHFTTPGHAQSHGMIERLHSTLVEHLGLLKLDRGIRGREAVARAVAAYNHSVHSATNRAPLELEDAGTDDETAIRRKIKRDKQKRTARFNENKAVDTAVPFERGDIVFKKNLCRREKGEPRFNGPYKVVQVLTRGRLRIEKMGPRRSTPVVAHYRELKRTSRKG